MKVPFFARRMFTTLYLRRRKVRFVEGAEPIFDNIFRPPMFVVYGRLTLGKGVKFFTHLGPTLIHVDADATMEIGDHSVIGSQVWIRASKEIIIGHSVLISRLVDIYDSNMHPKDEYHADVPRPVMIQANVWICAKSTILPGVSIGSYSIVGANSVVTDKVPYKHSVVIAGNPAKIVGGLEESSGNWTRVEF